MNQANAKVSGWYVWTPWQKGYGPHPTRHAADRAALTIKKNGPSH